MLLHIQRFIQQFKDIEEANYYLTNKLFLKIRKDLLPISSTLDLEDTGATVTPVYIYNYDLIRTPKSDPIAKECRGLILDSCGDIVSMSFPRFFNYGEGEAVKIDWATAVAENKEDGTLITIYKWEDQWRIQTRSMPQANGLMGRSDMITYQQAVKMLLVAKFDKDWDHAFKKFKNTFCFVFEFVSPQNRIVTPYEKTDLILLTIFDKMAEVEMRREAVDEYGAALGFTRPVSKPVRSLDDVKELLDKLDDLDEGLVIVDAHFNRIKIKNSSYLAVASTINAGSELSIKHLVNIVVSGDTDEIISYFPEYKQPLMIVSEAVNEIVEDLELVWATFGSIKEQKEFALEILKYPFNGILFAKRAGKIENIEEAVLNSPVDKLADEVKNRKGAVLDAAIKLLFTQKVESHEEG